MKGKNFLFHAPNKGNPEKNKKYKKLGGLAGELIIFKDQGIRSLFLHSTKE